MSDAIIVTDAESAECIEFMGREWEPYNRAEGVEWAVRSIHLAARAGGAMVGAAAGTVVGGVGELKQILGSETVARRGIGSQLWRAFEARCVALGCHKLRLETADYQARGFYERHGFTVLHELSDDRFHRTWFIMGKVLEASR